MAFSVQTALDSYVQSQQSIREPDGRWHPSGAFTCARQAVYQVRGTPPTNERSDRNGRVLYVGQQFHEIVQHAVREYPGVDEVWTEIPCVFEDPPISGSADQLIRYGDRYELQEFKSISSAGLHRGGLPKAEHVKQAMTYLCILRAVGSPGREAEGNVVPIRSGKIAPLGTALDRVRITYVSKDDLAIEEHLVFYSETLERDLFAYFRELDQYRLDGEALPPRMENKTKFPCHWKDRFGNEGYCDFWNKCWEQEESR